MNYVNLISTLILLIFVNVFSKNITFKKEYTYQASEADSKITCRNVASEQCKRLLLEQIGTYIESVSEIRNFKLTNDEITAITAGIVKFTILDEKWDGITYWLKAEITVNPDNIKKNIDDFRKDRKKLKELAETKLFIDKLLLRIDSLKTLVNKPKVNKRNLILKKYKIANQDLEAYKLYEKALSNFTDSLAIIYLNKAVKISPKFAQAYAKRAWHYYIISKKYDLALKDANHCLSIDENNIDARITRAEIFIHKGEYKSALKDYTHIITIVPDAIYAILARIRISKKLGDKNLFSSDSVKLVAHFKSEPFESKQFDDAFDFCTKCNFRSETFFEINQHKKAYSLLNYCIQNFFNYSDSFDWLEFGYKQLLVARFAVSNKIGWEKRIADSISVKNVIFAIDTCEKYRITNILTSDNIEVNKICKRLSNVIELCPNFAPAYYLRAICYKKKGLIKNAIEDFSKANTIAPNNIETLLERAEIYIERELYTLAKNDLLKAYSLDSTNFNTLSLAALLNKNMKNYKKAKKIYTKIVNIRQKQIQELDKAGDSIQKAGDSILFVFSIEDRAKLFIEMKDWNSAIKDYNYIFTIGYQCRANYNLAQLYFTKKEYAQSIVKATEAIKRCNSYEDAYFVRGASYGRLGHDKKCIEDCNRIISLNSKYDGAYFNRAISYMNLKQKDLAVKDLRNSAQLGNDEAKKMLAELGESW